MRKRKIKDADEASTDSSSDNLDFQSAQASARGTKITSEERRVQGFSGHQNASFATRSNILAVSAKAALNTSKCTDSRFCTQFYNIDGQGPIDASAKVNTHTIPSPRLQSGR